MSLNKKGGSNIILVVIIVVLIITAGYFVLSKKSEQTIQAPYTPISNTSYKREDLPTEVLKSNTANTLYRFNITAPATHNISIDEETLFVKQSGVEIDQFRIFVYIDRARTQLDNTMYSPLNELPDGTRTSVVFNTPNPVLITAGQTKYFEMRGIVGSFKKGVASVTTELQGFGNMTIKDNTTSIPQY